MSHANVINFQEEKKKRETKKSQDSFKNYIKLLELNDLENEVNFYLENFPSQSDLTSSFALRGQLLLKELANRVDDKILKASIHTMANNLDRVVEQYN